MLAGNGIASGSGMKADREQAILAALLQSQAQGCEYSRSPKMAVPTRTQVDPSSMATV